MKQRGFSLVELSIVLVILGLLVGGILAGRSLIRASELRAVMAEGTNYRTALQAFRDKYFAIPGDFATATSFWGDQATGTGACASAATPDGNPGTCNGNGDGAILWGQREQFLFWQHLALAGLVEGTYTGRQGPSNIAQHIPGTNAPASKVSGGGWGAWVNNTITGDSTQYAVFYGGLLVVGGITPDAPPYAKLFTPTEAWNIDTKWDDGRPGRGMTIARFWNNACTNSTSNTDLDGNYRLDDNTPQCALFMVRAY